MDVSGARIRQKEMPVLLFLVRLLSSNEELYRNRERTVTARLIIFLDDGGVMNDNNTRALQWQRLVSEFFAPLLSGPPDAWSRANRVVADRLFDPGTCRRRVQADLDYRSFERAYQVEWLPADDDSQGHSCAKPRTTALPDDEGDDLLTASTRNPCSVLLPLVQ